MKKKSIFILVGCILIIVIAVSCFLGIRKANYNQGREQGYLVGYSIGYTDENNGNDKQDSQVLAGSIVPYEYGGSKWKGFMIGFPSGYVDGYSATISVTIDD